MKKVLIATLAALFAFGLVSNCWANELKIAFADKLKILFEYKKAKDLNESLEKENAAAKTEFDRKSADIKKLREEIELLNEKARGKKQAELDEKLRDLDNFRREKQREIGQKYDEGIKAISAEIGKVCDEFGTKNGYDAIIDTRAVVYIPEPLDITDQILKELNK